MRITLLLGALSAIIVSTAMALNDTTAAAPTFAVDIQAHHPKPSGPRKIPVTMMKCTNHILSEEDYLGAKEKSEQFSGLFSCFSNSRAPAFLFGLREWLESSETLTSHTQNSNN